MHHEPLSRLVSRLPLKLTGLQTTPVALLLMLMRVPEAKPEQQPETQPEIDLIHHQPQSFGDFGHGYYYSRRPYTKLTCFPFSYYRSKGTTSLPRCWRRGATTRETSSQLANSLNRKKHKLCLSISYTTLQPKGTTSLQSLSVQTTMEPLPHGLLVLSSSKPLTGRTGHQLRDASAPGTTGDTALTGTLPLLPDKDSSYDDDMPCRTPLH